MGVVDTTISLARATNR